MTNRVHIKQYIKLIIVIYLFIANIVYGKIYFIDSTSGDDSNPGTAKEAPWKKCPGMPGFAGSYSHSAGDIFIFKGGVTWGSDCITFNIGYSGAKGSKDVYTIDSTWYIGASYSPPIIDAGKSMMDWQRVISLDNKNYIKINGIKIINLGNPYQRGNYYCINANPLGSGIEISNCEFIPYANHTFMFTISTSADIADILIHDNKISHSTNSIEFGRGYNGTSTVTGLKIYNNEIFDPHTQLVDGDHGDGIHIWDLSGIYYCTGLEIYNNKFYGDWGGADAITSCTAQIYLEGSAKDVKIYNNQLSYSNKSSERIGFMFSPGFMDISCKRLVQIYNNTVYAAPLTTHGADFGASSGIRVGGGGEIIIKGNIVYNTKYGIDIKSGYQSLDVDYNDIRVRVVSGDYAEYGIIAGKYYTSLSSWQSSGQGAHSIESYPQFADTSGIPLDLALSSSSLAVDLFPTSEAPTTIFTTDIGGIIRPQGSAWDAGAYERINIFPNPPKNLRIEKEESN